MQSQSSGLLLAAFWVYKCSVKTDRFSPLYPLKHFDFSLFYKASLKTNRERRDHQIRVRHFNCYWLLIAQRYSYTLLIFLWPVFFWLMLRVGWKRWGQGSVGFNAQMKDAFSQPQPGCQVLFSQCSHFGVEEGWPSPSSCFLHSRTIFAELQKRIFP